MSLSCCVQRPAPSTMAVATGRVRTQPQGSDAAALWDSRFSLMAKHVKVSNSGTWSQEHSRWAGAARQRRSTDAIAQYANGMLTQHIDIFPQQEAPTTNWICVWFVNITIAYKNMPTNFWFLFKSLKFLKFFNLWTSPPAPEVVKTLSLSSSLHCPRFTSSSNNYRLM